jgi:hypothetical protein
LPNKRNIAEHWWFMPIILATWIGGIMVPGQRREKKNCKCPSQREKVGVVAIAWHPSNAGKCEIKRIRVKTGLGKKQDPISKIAQGKSTVGIAQVVERLS